MKPAPINEECKAAERKMIEVAQGATTCNQGVKYLVFLMRLNII